MLYEFSNLIFLYFKVLLNEFFIVSDDGCWDLIDAHCIGKFQTSVVRKRAITMLPPKILEKKNQRIQEKAAS